MKSTTPSPIAKTGTSATRRKLLVASNRLPTSLKTTDGKLQAFPSSGGLASALSGFRSDIEFQWIGWPGGHVPADQEPLVTELLKQQQLAPVFLTRDQEEQYYQQACNQVLWPLFHYYTDRISFSDSSWAHYVAVNRMFADRILEHCEPDSRVWIHDFHLMLVPSMLREQQPDLEIGFFLHTPFPSSEIYRLLPTRTEVLKGLLGADYIGFHTNEYARHFRSSCLRVLGLESEPNSILHEGRRVGIGTNPIGIDVDGFRQTLHSKETARLLEDLRHRYGNRKLILGVERLDYTKGIPLKLQAFQRFLEKYPERARDVTFLQVIVPSRLTHPEYQELKADIEGAVGRINGLHGGPGATPVEYMHRSLSPEQLVSLYRFADVGFVAPARDGMNLVAQELVLCQEDSGPADPFKGILVLSEFAGAAHYLSRSILVNPCDIEATADALERALSMGDREKRERMATMAHQVEEMDCRKWAECFLLKQGEVAAEARIRQCSRRIAEEETTRLHADFCAAGRRIFALDYDGTLREIERHPDEAAPTAEILELLRVLSSLPDTEVHLVSGRKHETMEEWFGDLPIHLCAEHGYTARTPSGRWSPLHELDLTWMPEVEETLRRVAGEVPGALVERKTCNLAWHYRMADLDYGEWRARELLVTLEENLANQPVEVVAGHRVIEVRASGVNKGGYVRRLVEHTNAETFILCAGDDSTDMDMYRVLPSHAVSIHVGIGDTDSAYTVESPARMRAILQDLAKSGMTPHLERLALS